MVVRKEGESAPRKRLKTLTTAEAEKKPRTVSRLSKVEEVQETEDIKTSAEVKKTKKKEIEIKKTETETENTEIKNANINNANEGQNADRKSVV